MGKNQKIVDIFQVENWEQVDSWECSQFHRTLTAIVVCVRGR